MGDTARIVGGALSVHPVDLLTSGVSDRAFRLWCVLHRYAGLPLGAVPGRQRLANEMSTSLSSLDRAKAELVAVRFLEVRQRVRYAGEIIYADELPADASSGGELTSSEYLVHQVPYPETAGAEIPRGGSTVTSDATLPSPVTPERDTLNPSLAGDDSETPESDPQAIPETHGLTPDERRLLGELTRTAAANGVGPPVATLPAGSDAERVIRRGGLVAEDIPYAVAQASEYRATFAYAVGVLERISNDRLAGRDPYRRRTSVVGAGGARGGFASRPELQPERFRRPPPPPAEVSP